SVRAPNTPARRIWRGLTWPRAPSPSSQIECIPSQGDDARLQPASSPCHFRKPSMSGASTTSTSFFAPAFVLAHGEAARLFLKPFSDGRSLLEFVLAAARKAERVTRVIVLSHDRPVIEAASKLGAEGIHYHPDDDL